MIESASLHTARGAGRIGGTLRLAHNRALPAGPTPVASGGRGPITSRVHLAVRSVEGTANADADDWDTLFRAVADRLLLSVGQPVAGSTLRPKQLAPERVRICVLECVAALEQLQRSVRRDPRRSRVKLLDVAQPSPPA